MVYDLIIDSLKNPSGLSYMMLEKDKFTQLITKLKLAFPEEYQKK
jgi:uncharacterized circularly permuted ATP-grasp superfamily protein